MGPILPCLAFKHLQPLNYWGAWWWIFNSLTLLFFSNVICLIWNTVSPGKPGKDTQMSWARDSSVETEQTHIAHPFFLMRYFKNRAKNTSQGKAVTVSMVPLNEKNFKVFAPACLLHPMLWKTFSYFHFPPCRLHSINLLSLHALTEPAPPFGPSSLAFLPAVFFTLFFL